MEVAYLSAKEDAIKTLQEPVPLQIRNAPTKLMKELNYGKDYDYSHDYKYHMTDMVCMPDGLIDRQYYKPSDQGSEVKVKNRMDYINAIKAQLRKSRRKK